jgi:AraC-like DNA-binding protein
MELDSSLLLHEERLETAAEWSFPAPGWTFAWLLSGDGYLMGCNPARAIGAGAVAVHGGGIRLTLRASRLGPVRFRWFRLEPSALFGVFTLFERRRIDHPEDSEPPLPWVLEGGTPAARRFAGVEPSRGASALEQRAHLLELVSVVLSPPPFTSGIPVGSPRDAGDRLEELLHRITDSELMTLPVEELARRCRCEPRRLLSIYRERFGESLPGQQREWRRLRACALLAQPGTDITTVARACGYDGVDAFRAWFRREFGMAPSQWRERGQANATGVDSGAIR